MHKVDAGKLLPAIDEVQTCPRSYHLVPCTDEEADSTLSFAGCSLITSGPLVPAVHRGTRHPTDSHTRYNACGSHNTADSP